MYYILFMLIQRTEGLHSRKSRFTSLKLNAFYRYIWEFMWCWYFLWKMLILFIIVQNRNPLSPKERESSLTREQRTGVYWGPQYFGQPLMVMSSVMTVSQGGSELSCKRFHITCTSVFISWCPVLVKPSFSAQRVCIKFC